MPQNKTETECSRRSISVTNIEVHVYSASLAEHLKTCCFGPFYTVGIVTN